MDGGNGIQCPGAHGCQAARIFQEVSLDSWGGSPFESGRGLGSGTDLGSGECMLIITSWRFGIFRSCALEKHL